jgi:hypothetical protein
MSLLEDMTDTLVMTSQEEDFGRGNSSKDGRADDSDHDDHDKSSRKKGRRRKKTRGTRRERTELAQVANSDSNDKKGVREADNKMAKKLNEISLGLSLNRKRILSAGPYLWAGHGPQSKGMARTLNRLPFLGPIFAVGRPLDDPGGPRNQL